MTLRQENSCNQFCFLWPGHMLVDHKFVQPSRQTHSQSWTSSAATPRKVNGKKLQLWHVQKMSSRWSGRLSPTDPCRKTLPRASQLFNSPRQGAACICKNFQCWAAGHFAFHWNKNCDSASASYHKKMDWWFLFCILSPQKMRSGKIARETGCLFFLHLAANLVWTVQQKLEMSHGQNISESPAGIMWHVWWHHLWIKWQS